MRNCTVGPIDALRKSQASKATLVALIVTDNSQRFDRIPDRYIIGPECKQSRLVVAPAALSEGNFLVHALIMFFTSLCFSFHGGGLRANCAPGAAGFI
jgi:hypothetical protein